MENAVSIADICRSCYDIPMYNENKAQSDERVRTFMNHNPVAKPE